MQGALLRILLQAAFVGVLVYSLKGAPQLPARLASRLLSRATLAGTTLDDFEGDVLDKIRSQLDFRAWLQHEAPPYQAHIKSALTLYLLFYMFLVTMGHGSVRRGGLKMGGPLSLSFCLKEQE
eukprot:COSAG04_NODE_14166_length_578_cov_0.868476_1_plen_122_part_10